MLSNLARVHDRQNVLCKPESLGSVKPRSTDESNRAFSPAAIKRGKHRPVPLWLGGRNGAVRVSDNGCCDRAALQDQVRLHSEKRWVPDAQIGEFPNLDRTDIGRNSLRYCRIDRVFRDVTPYS